MGEFTSRLPANPPVDFERMAEPGDALEILVNGTNPDGYTDWDDLRLLLHYQKVLLRSASGGSDLTSMADGIGQELDPC